MALDQYKDIGYLLLFKHSFGCLITLALAIVTPFACFHMMFFGNITFSIQHSLLVYFYVLNNKLEDCIREENLKIIALLGNLPTFYVQMIELQNSQNPISFIQVLFPIFTFASAMSKIIPHSVGENFFNMFADNNMKGDAIALCVISTLLYGPYIFSIESIMSAMVEPQDVNPTFYSTGLLVREDPKTDFYFSENNGPAIVGGVLGFFVLVNGCKMMIVFNQVTKDDKFSGPDDFSGKAVDLEME